MLSLVIGSAALIGVIGFALATSKSNKRRRREQREHTTTTVTAADLFGPLSTDDKGEPVGNAPSADGDGLAPVTPRGQGQSGGGKRPRGIPARPPGDQSQGASDQREPQVLVIYVMARGQGELRCSGVNRVLTRAGCVLDERGVFRMKDADQNGIFAVVNAFEPGTFDQGRIDMGHTRGLVFFMEVRNWQDKQRFDTMLKCARQLARELDGELLDDKREPLSSVREAMYKANLKD